MLEAMQWVVLLGVGGVVGWLVRERQKSEIPTWLRDLQEEDMVTRGDLDRYHLRVVQLSQTQKDLIESRTEEIFTRLEKLEDRTRSTGPLYSAPAQAPATVQPTAAPDRLPEPELPLLDSLLAASAAHATEVKTEATVETVVTAPASSQSLSPVDRVIRLSEEGKSIEEIAVSLRMGRQEVQLLLQMARRRMATHAGV